MTINLTDPANHPANGPLTVERIARVRDELQRTMFYVSGGVMDYIVADAIKGLEELLVSREVEPVADVVAWSSPNEERTCDIRWRRFDVAPGPLYAAPPAPVVPTFDEWLELRANKPLGWVKDSMREAYDACRAAMINNREE